jgi:intracellular septation protein A
MAFVAEYIRRTLSTEDWVNYHFPILYVPTLIFMFANVPFVMKHNLEPPASETPPA